MKSTLITWRKNKEAFLKKLQSAEKFERNELGEVFNTFPLEQSYSKIKDDIMSCMTFATVKVDSYGNFTRSFNLCRNRFCPLCNHFLSLKRAQIFCDIYKDYKNSYDFYEAVLTVPNVELVHYIFDIKHVFSNYIRRLRSKYPGFGYTANFECTFNSDRKDYHPHLHCTFAFPRDTKIPFSHLNKLWSDCYRRYYNLPKDDFISLQTRFSKLKIGTNPEYPDLFEYFKYGFKFSNNENLPPHFSELINEYSNKKLFVKGGFISDVWSFYSNPDEYIELDPPEDFTNTQPSNCKTSIIRFTTPLHGTTAYFNVEPGFFSLIKTFDFIDFESFLHDLKEFVNTYIDPDLPFSEIERQLHILFDQEKQPNDLH